MPRKKNPFDTLKTPDGLGARERLGPNERKFLLGLIVPFAGNDLFCNKETAQRFTLALDMADKINRLLLKPGDAIDFVFRPFEETEEGIKARPDSFSVRLVRVDETPGPAAKPAAANDPCCMWKWDPRLNRWVCVAMC